MKHLYQNLSRYRSELMGLAMLWVMLFHAYQFHFYIPLLDAFKAVGFAGVDVFILLSAMGLYVSLASKRERERERERFPHSSSAVFPGSCPLTGWWWGCIVCG